MTHSELRKYLHAHPALKRELLGAEWEWQDVFGALDDGETGAHHAFTLREWTGFVLKRAFAAEIFAAADKNGDGRLTHSELRKYLKTHRDVKLRLLGESFAWQAVFAAIDTKQHGECMVYCCLIYCSADADVNISSESC